MLLSSLVLAGVLSVGQCPGGRCSAPAPSGFGRVVPAPVRFVVGPVHGVAPAPIRYVERVVGPRVIVSTPYWAESRCIRTYSTLPFASPSPHRFAAPAYPSPCAGGVCPAR